LARFSANLGFLWKDFALPDAIRNAAKAGFDAVECHWPYTTPSGDVSAALAETGLPMISLNTLPGDEASDFGLAALPGQTTKARDSIDKAIAYAAEIGARNVHVMAGRAEGDQAYRTFLANLRYAALQAEQSEITILVEPINSRDVPGYFLQSTAQAERLIGEAGCKNVKLLFDCYHVQIMEGDITRRIERYLPIIGHVQIASVPARAEPDGGELDYSFVVRRLSELGYTSSIGAEYLPASSVSAGLGWLECFKAF
jgi:hydroxypyruvate isomerase